MIPFVAARGLLITLSFLVGGYEIAISGVEIATKNSLFDLPILADFDLTKVPAAANDSAPELRIMAAVMLAGKVPPLAMALATVVRPRLFNAVEKEDGKAARLLGASFITEGAIPFAAADPLRVIPPIMLGGGGHRRSGNGP